LCARAVQHQLAHYPPFRLLVVEDDPITLRAVAGTLQMNFEKPDTAKDGLQALELAQEKIYDVIFSDIEMPNMGGFGLCTRLRECGPNRDTPIIFITTHTDAESRKQAVESGGSDFIGKPFLPIEITVKAFTWALGHRIRNWIPIDLWPSSSV
jgi:two-component system sensor histidine kinase BarA